MDHQSLIFRDRADAGLQLAAALPRFDAKDTIVVALPRGGVPVAAEICAAHNLPLDLVLVRKIGAPGRPELAVGAVTDGARPQVIVNDAIARSFRLSTDAVEDMGRKLLPEIERRRQTYLSGRKSLVLKGKNLIVVDDGVATGATLHAGLQALKLAAPKHIIVALPVGPSDLAAQLGNLADTVICLKDLRHFAAVGGAYRSFPQVDDATVRAAVDQYALARTG